jgi:hypothetical protein
MVYARTLVDRECTMGAVGEEPARTKPRRVILAGAVAIAILAVACALTFLAHGGQRGDGPPRTNLLEVDLRSGAIVPAATLTFNGLTTSGWGGGTCWVQPSGAEGCQDVVGPTFTEKDYVSIPASTLLQIDGDAATVTAKVLTGAGNIYVSGVPVILVRDLGTLRSPIALDLAPGRYQLSLIGHWSQGDREFLFPVRIVDGSPRNGASAG